MRRIGVAALAFVAALAGGTVHADDPPGGQIRWDSHWNLSSQQLAAQVDPKAGQFYLEAEFWECNNDLPPDCWKVSAIRFYGQVDLGYRHHGFRGRSAISYGTLRWSEWTAKRHRMRCWTADNKACGRIRVVPHPQNTWSDLRYYTPTMFPQHGHFTFRASACVGVWCGFGATRSPDIVCYPVDEQCYFDV